MHAETAIERKIERLRRGGSPRVLDLFAGCGGLSLGFQAAGYEIAAAVEADRFAAESHALNFHRDAPARERARHARPRNISSLEPAELCEELDLGPAIDSIDIVIGGPPCQSFARIGRAKLRAVREQPEAWLDDHRSDLYLRFLEYVEVFQPLAVLMENVPEVLNHGGENIAEQTSQALEDSGYEAIYTLLNAVHYGVPQLRERVFVLAIRRELGVKPHFPQPQCEYSVPQGYRFARTAAMKQAQLTLFGPTPHFVPAPTAGPSLPPAPTAEQALGDLPRLTRHLEAGGENRTGPLPYREGSASNYAALIREWPGFEAGFSVTQHITRKLPRDYPIFARMQPGDQYPEAYQIAQGLAEAKRKRRELEGETIEPGSAEDVALIKTTVPPYDPNKFPNKWRKMEPDAPSRTVMAHLGKDSYTHIHYDSDQARTITVRESARLQSFPDSFRFSGSMNSAFRQIGNAVPPLLAKALALQLRLALRGS